MVLDQLGSIGSIISGIAVVISLIYLAIQIRRNTEAERTATYQSIVSDFGAMNNNLAGNPELSHMFVEALENYHEFNGSHCVALVVGKATPPEEEEAASRFPKFWFGDKMELLRFQRVPF